MEVGDNVKAMSSDDEAYYPGVIEKVNKDGTYTVKWDDPDGGPETEDVELDNINKLKIFKDYVVGDDCTAKSPDDGRIYPGVVSKVNKDGSFTVTWDDPDGGPETADVKPIDMRKVNIYKDYKVDDRVEAVFPEDGNMYAATVTKVNKDGTFDVKWDDPDGGPEETTVTPKQMKVPPIPYDSLEVGQKYQGTVRSVLDFGAFVDIGAETDGLVHISAVSRERVDNIHDYVEEGQQIEVWVSGIRGDGKYGLTMIEGKVDGGGGRAKADLTPFSNLNMDDWHKGTVDGVVPFGAFVSVTLEDGATASGLVHISQLQDGFVENVDDVVEVGQEVSVRVLSVDMERGKMSLSMREGYGGGGGGGGPREMADVAAFESISSSEWLTGKVARTAAFGAFVTVSTPDGGATADGLVHITKIKDGFVESVEDEVEVGQEVRVRVDSVDVAGGKLGLSMKEEDSY